MCSSGCTNVNLCMSNLSSESHAFLSTVFCYNYVSGLRFHLRNILNVKLKKRKNQGSLKMYLIFYSSWQMTHIKFLVRGQPFNLGIGGEFQMIK